MDLDIYEQGGISMALSAGLDMRMDKVQDAVDLIMNASYQGAEVLVMKVHQVSPEFFDLRSGLAGEILQKFSTYNFKLVLLGDFSILESKNLQEFIFESNRTKRICFVKSIDEYLNLVKH